MTALDKLRAAKEFLAGSGIDDAHREAELIISYCLGTDRVSLYRDNPKIPHDISWKIDGLLDRRRNREPLQYVLGYAEFCGLKIKVGRGVLIPRPETELLVEEAIETFKTKRGDSHPPPVKRARMLDLCTGSGCIALALGKAFPDAEIYGTDTSETAIAFAEENAGINNSRNVTFLKGSLFKPLKALFASRRSPAIFDLIISNPPYIQSRDIENLQPEIREWEPAAALDGGGDGLDYYSIIIPEARNYLGEDGFLIMEIGMGQAKDIKEMAENAGFRRVSLVKDYAGIERILIARKE
jgi:release factor glutamine methyltransferase